MRMTAPVAEAPVETEFSDLPLFSENRRAKGEFEGPVKLAKIKRGPLQDEAPLIYQDKAYGGSLIDRGKDGIRNGYGAVKGGIKRPLKKMRLASIEPSTKITAPRPGSHFMVSGGMEHGAGRPSVQRVIRQSKAGGRFYRWFVRPVILGFISPIAYAIAFGMEIAFNFIGIGRNSKKGLWGFWTKTVGGDAAKFVVKTPARLLKPFSRHKTFAEERSDKELKQAAADRTIRRERVLDRKRARDMPAPPHIREQLSQYRHPAERSTPPDEARPPRFASFEPAPSSGPGRGAPRRRRDRSRSQGLG